MEDETETEEEEVPGSAGKSSPLIWNSGVLSAGLVSGTAPNDEPVHVYNVNVYTNTGYE